MRLLMELTNKEGSQKIVFYNNSGKLEVRLEDDYNPSQFTALETYDDIDFDKFIENIKKLKEA